MTRTYKRKSTRASYGEESLHQALAAIKERTPLKTVARQYNIPARTLRRHRDEKVLQPGNVKLGRFDSDIPLQHEKDLVSIIQVMEKALFGLSTTDVRRLAYDFAEKMGLQHRFSKELKMAGVDWMYGFMKRNHELSIRQPEATNISRAVGFNQEQVNAFFNLYEELLSECFYNSTKVWNVDETGISTVQKPIKVVATKGTRHVGRVTSGERGQTVTVMCAVSAAGIYIPPMFIFPRKRMVDSLMNEAPPGAIGVCTPSGWTDSECFMKWLKHFVSIVKPSKDDKHVIFLDGHHSHKTLEAVLFCRENGIELVTFPPHCTHKMQPLDVTFFKGLKAAYNATADGWMLCNKGRRITFYEIAGLFAKSYLKVATPEKAVRGFECTGLWPLNRQIFSEEDFFASLLTDEPMPGTATQVYPTQEAVEPTSEAVPEVAPSSCSTSSNNNFSLDPKTALMEIVGPIKAVTLRKRKRKTEKATILTSSPHKDFLEDKEKNKSRPKRQLVKSRKREKINKTDCEPCNSCQLRYCDDVTGRNWIQCQSQTCLKWYHNECQGLEENYREKQFICINCDDDSE